MLARACPVAGACAEMRCEVARHGSPFPEALFPHRARGQTHELRAECGATPFLGALRRRPFGCLPLCPKVPALETPRETCRARPWRAQRPSGGSRRIRRKSIHSGSPQAVAPAPPARDAPHVSARAQAARRVGAGGRAGGRTGTRTILHGKMSWSGLPRSVALSHSLPLSASHMAPLVSRPFQKRKEQSNPVGNRA